ncbi:interferon-stimulated 20 kDa exonuclease-like 2 [Genypterus blacodes]|uniref:interferon-stimulated 20 kDa exonuclease-like 2 n=1 Tax=Genypterus blacodes TaxID=154954 RepID=UPI003F769BC3
MSDIIINTCAADVPVEKKKNQNRFRMCRFFEKNGCRRGKQANNNNNKLGPGKWNQIPHTSSPSPSSSSSTHDRNVPHTDCSSKPSPSTHSLPSLTVTVTTPGTSGQSVRPVSTKPSGSFHRPSAQTSAGVPTKYLAIDCEMVGAGLKGQISQLARCSVVSFTGDVVYDKFIQPAMPVTDYRTRWSGIRSRDLVNAMPYKDARKEILRLLMGKVVIGHAIHNDFKALGYTHPAVLTRDTSRIPLLNVKAGFGPNECASLKRLTKAIFNRDIQTGRKGHSSVEDAKATMELYKVVEAEWERKLASKT